VSDQTEQYQPHIDAVRGAMAMWVFVSHTALLCGFNTRFIPSGGIAVEVFMFISGLLMTRNFLARQRAEPIGSVKTILTFLIRRFFRIAPLYYPLLAIALIFWSEYLQMFKEATTLFPPAWAGLLFNDPSQREPTLLNVLAHLSFLFGLFPIYASNNALPDWSLALEMQFYLAIPFILLSSKRFGLTAVVLSLMIVQAIANRYIGLYLTPTDLGLWPQPTLLPFRINCFMAGVTMAAYFFRRDIASFILVFILIFWNQDHLFSVVVLFCFLAMLDITEVPFGRAIGFIKAKISGSVGRFFGDISYAVYLTHMLILFPLFHYLLTFQHFRLASAFLRFGILTGIGSVIIIPVAFVAHILIEKKGIEFGRGITRRIWRNPHVAQAATGY
jgi:peptidoglycan/LPS O-acetylase OafA/YrhL